jgi:hypothetical protein
MQGVDEALQGGGVHIKCTEPTHPHYTQCNFLTSQRAAHEK